MELTPTEQRNLDDFLHSRIWQGAPVDPAAPPAWVVEGRWRGILEHSPAHQALMGAAKNDSYAHLAERLD